MLEDGGSCHNLPPPQRQPVCLMYCVHKYEIIYRETGIVIIRWYFDALGKEVMTVSAFFYHTSLKINAYRAPRTHA